ncbi:MAG TPA: efflux RND transporter periplasmic adaptor subunit [Janthinobacterium sp.]|nr:efflux RND transporter periplasmic adaptor subunit [Janthinobacterium sp.]
MKRHAILLALAASAAIGAAAYGLYAAGLRQGQAQAAAPANATPAGKKVLYWQDPMTPGQKFDRPGKSPFMDMQLVPVYAGDDGDEGKVRISPRVRQNLGIRTALVARGTLSTPVDVVGAVAYNERDVALVQARGNGYVERLYVRAPLERVRKGQPLADLYVPDWVAAQEEFFAVRRMGGTSGADGLLDAARQRMRLAGMAPAQIRAVEASGKVQARLGVTAPIAGVVAELSAREGMTVVAGAPLFRLNGTDTVWVNAELPESVAALVRPGTPALARAAALPGVLFKGSVGAILPEVDPLTRTLKARIELANPGGRLVPGMFVGVSLAPAARRDVLLLPSEALIRTGTRSVVVLANEDGSFQPVDVETGAESDARTEIRKGLVAGQKVVLSGQFLLDSEASLRATTTRMSAPPPLPPPPGMDSAPAAEPARSPSYRASGKVEKIGPDEITISHGPIPALHWEAMTMGFKAPPDGFPPGVVVGATVAFEIRAGADGRYAIVAIAPRAPSAPRASSAASAKGGAQ